MMSGRDYDHGENESNLGARPDLESWTASKLVQNDDFNLLNFHFALTYLQRERVGKIFFLKQTSFNGAGDIAF